MKGASGMGEGDPLGTSVDIVRRRKDTVYESRKSQFGERAGVRGNSGAEVACGLRSQIP